MKIAAVTILAALGALAGYAMFSGPTTVGVLAPGGSATPVPSKVSPPSKQAPRDERDGDING